VELWTKPADGVEHTISESPDGLSVRRLPSTQVIFNGVEAVPESMSDDSDRGASTPPSGISSRYILVDRFGTARLAETLDRPPSDPTLRETLGHAARRRAEDFMGPAIAAEHRLCYQTAVKP
jgi:hypothetical protein